MKLKNTLFILFLMICSYWGTAQNNLVTNGDFSQYDPNCPDFNFTGNTSWSNCVVGWTEFRNHPSLWGAPTNPYAWMWSANGSFEALQTRVAFEQGKCYTISFRVRTNDNGNINANTNGTINLRAVNLQNGVIQNQQNIYMNSIGGNYLNNWKSITVSFTPTTNFSTLIINPLYSGSAPQAEMSIDDIVIEEDSLAVDFVFKGTSGAVKNTFCAGESIFLDGSASTDEHNYFIDVWRRPKGNIGNFQHVSALGWTAGELDIIDLTALFGATGASFELGYEYEIKVALNNACNGWLPLTKRFTVLGNVSLNPNFTMNTFCAENGTISAQVITAEPTAYQWWGLFETANGGITGGTQVGTIQGGNTYTFTGLNRTKNYYIKHGVWKNSDKNACYPWQENRQIITTPVGWAGQTSDFNISLNTNFNNIVEISTQADSNAVNVNHLWDLYDSNDNVVGTTYCCSVDAVTYSGLSLNTWYYIKHGIWNNCIGWTETRIYFRVETKKSRNNIGEFILETKEYPYEPDSNYTREINELIASGAIYELYEEYAKGKQPVSSSKMEMYPNPALTGKTLTIATSSKEVIQKIELVTLSGKSTALAYTVQKENIQIPLDARISKGMYFVRITKQSGEIITKQLAIQ
ncbi:T9SS type A sorting domain-containing protein [Aquimarina algiphila]|uniref:T9SS type A sorting domain-containing protein n=1 Tax=Aquimarina algiphila TaxID=2047982 RepID=UPI00232B607D|nr:T9SS type A sorting domain-containing protein [Aquimarina algiphila]